MINQFDYSCPKCDVKLSKNNLVLFNVNRNKDKTVKLFLDPKPLVYSFKCEPKTTFIKDEIVNFSCFNCNVNLQSDKYPNFLYIVLKVTDKVVFDVFFSRIYGDHRTYVGIEDFEEEYGHKIAS